MGFLFPQKPNVVMPTMAPAAPRDTSIPASQQLTAAKKVEDVPPAKVGYDPNTDAASRQRAQDSATRAPLSASKVLTEPDEDTVAARRRLLGVHRGEV